MQKMDINFRNVLSTKDHGCLKHLKVKLVEKRDQWETVLLNVKHVLRSVLKALDYMHGQGLVHRDVKGKGRNTNMHNRYKSYGQLYTVFLKSIV